MCTPKVDERAAKFLRIEPMPIYHLKKAELALGELVIDYRHLSGEGVDAYTLLCEAQNEILLALKALEKLGVGK